MAQPKVHFALHGSRRRPAVVAVARAWCRAAMVLGVGAMASRPGLHRLVKRVYRFVPGLQPTLRRFLPAPPVQESAATVAEDLYGFRPGPAPRDASGVVTVEHLYHLSRSL